MQRPDATGVLRLIDDLSLEMTGTQVDIDSLGEAAPHLAAGTRVNVTYLGNEDLSMRLAAASAVLKLGFRPVPHVSARRLRSEAELVEFLAALREIGASKRILVVGGDPDEPMGPYASSLDVIRSGLLPQNGVEEVSVAGYPEGHPDITTDVLWCELEGKTAAIAEQGLGAVIVTQFGFDTHAVVAWVARVRERGVHVPIRIGTPGPAGVRRLLRYARRFGVGANAMIVKKYGFSLANLMGSAGPDRFVTDLADELPASTDAATTDGATTDPATTDAATTAPATTDAATTGAGRIGLHFYTFGGITATATWAERFIEEQRPRR